MAEQVADDSDSSSDVIARFALAALLWESRSKTQNPAKNKSEAGRSRNFTGADPVHKFVLVRWSNARSQHSLQTSYVNDT